MNDVGLIPTHYQLNTWASRKGVKVQAYHGAFFLRSSDLLALPSVDCDKAFGVQLSLQENLTTSYNFIQAALLYTTSTSERRIRVLNMCLPTTSNMQDMFNLADGEAVAALLIKMAIDRALQAKISDAREALVNKVVDILASYRQTLGTGQANAQLLLPATLTSLPLHILAMIKHPVMRAYQDVNPDLRAYHMQRFRSLSSSRTLLALYPHLYALHTLTDETPAVLTLSSEKLDRQGAFLLDNGEVLLLWVGKAISIEFLQHVFGLSSLDGVDPNAIQINKETSLGARVSQLIESLRAEKGIYQPLCVLRDGEPSSSRFLSCFVEDRTKTLYSYYEFLMQLQKQVSAKFTR
jgi:protein transport protein SEC24